MALIQVDFISECLHRTITMQAIIPADKLEFPSLKRKKTKPFKTLYLLHGIIGNRTDWVTGTRIMSWAQDKDLAVIMPSGENGMYLDIPGRCDMNYGEFIGRELVEFTRDLFHLSDKREDTFIAGLSMGGYGAIRNGLKYSDTFSHIGGFSSALIVNEAKNLTEEGMFPAQRRSHMQTILGDLDQVEGSDKDCMKLFLELKRSGKPIPKMYLCCGEDDFLLPQNRDYVAFLREQNAEPTYEEGPGSHEWDYWDTHVKKFLDWLPLDMDSDQGMHSGNIGIEQMK